MVCCHRNFYHDILSATLIFIISIASTRAFTTAIKAGIIISNLDNRDMDWINWIPILFVKSEWLNIAEIDRRKKEGIHISLNILSVFGFDWKLNHIDRVLDYRTTQGFRRLCTPSCYNHPSIQSCSTLNHKW